MIANGLRQTPFPSRIRRKQGIIYIYTHTHTHIYIYVCIYIHLSPYRESRRSALDAISLADSSERRSFILTVSQTAAQSRASKRGIPICTCKITIIITIFKSQANLKDIYIYIYIYIYICIYIYISRIHIYINKYEYLHISVYTAQSRESKKGNSNLYPQMNTATILVTEPLRHIP